MPRRHLAEVSRVVQCCPVECVFEEWIEALIEALGDKLNIARFHGGHKRCHASLTHCIDLQVLAHLVHQYLERRFVPRSAREVQRSSADRVACVRIGIQRQYLSHAVSVAVGSDVHEYSDSTTFDNR